MFSFFMCLLLSSFDTTKAKKVFVLISMSEWMGEMDLMGRIGQEIGVGVRGWKKSCFNLNLMQIEETNRVSNYREKNEYEYEG